MSKTGRRDKGDGSLFQRDNGLWVASVELPAGADGKRRRKFVTSRDYATAAKKLRDLRRAVEDSGGDMPTRNMTTAKWLGYWLENIAGARLKPRALQGYRTAVTRHLIPHVGRYRLDRLAPAHVREMHKALERQGLASGTILKAHRVLGKALVDAQREGHVPRNVASLVDAPEKTSTSSDVLTSEQAKVLLAHVADDPLGSRWAAALLLGPRQGEIIGLEWDRVDLEAWTLDLSWQIQRLGFRHGCDGTCGRQRAGWCPSRVLDVRRGFEHRTIDGSALVFTRPKSKAGQRLIPLPAPLAAILTRLHEQAGRPSSGLVWTRPNGRPLDPRRDLDAWKDALRSAGLPPVRLHVARHTTATLLLEAGVDAHVIKAILGHSEVVTTRGYQHVDLTLARRALENLGTSLAIGA